MSRFGNGRKQISDNSPDRSCEKGPIRTFALLYESGQSGEMVTSERTLGEVAKFQN